MAKNSPSFKELLAQAKTPEEKQAVERAFQRARGRVGSLTDAKALGAVGGPKIGGGGTYTFKAGDNLFDVAESIYGSERYIEQLVAANPWLRDSNGNLSTNVPIGSTLKIPVLRTGLPGADIRISQNFWNGVQGGTPTVLGATAAQAAQTAPTTLANQPQQYNPNYGGTTLPLQSAGQPLVGDTVRPGAGGTRVMQTGSTAPAPTAPQGFASPSQLQATQYGNMPTPPNVNNPLGTGTSALGLAGRQQQQATFEAGLPAFPANTPTTTLAGGQTVPNAALQNAPAPIDNVYGFPTGGNSLNFLSNPANANAFLTFSLFEKAGSEQQFYAALNAAGLAQTPPADTTAQQQGTAGGPLFTPYEAGVYTGITEKFLRQAGRRRERAAASRRLPRNYAPSPFINQASPAFSANGIIDRALNWRIGF